MAVDQREDRKRDREHDHRDPVEGQLEREGLLECNLLVGIVLLDVFVADPDLLQPQERPERDGQEAPDAVVLARQVVGQREPAHEAQGAQDDHERRVDHHAARGVGPQVAVTLDQLLAPLLERGDHGHLGVVGKARRLRVGH